MEHRSRYVARLKLGGKDFTTGVDALMALVNKLTELMHTLTWDRGTHARFTVASALRAYRASRACTEARYEPPMTLGWKTPAETLDETVAKTG